MLVQFYGTRGSIPIAGRDSVVFGGNSTCVHVKSSCLPSDHWLVIDGGSGMVPLARKGVQAGVKEVSILFTHYHHDHTQGLLLSPWLYKKEIVLNLYGPLEHKVGPVQVLERLMDPPLFPIAYAQVSSHVRGRGFEHPPGVVIAVHPVGGVKVMPVDELERAESSTSNGQLTFSGKGRFAVGECLIVRMFRSNHPERTICYRLEERPTGKVFVFLTDHENQEGTPADLRRHLANADLLVMDSQYPRAKFDKETAGFGHGTADYCVSIASEVEAKRLGLTHHDPFSTDTDIEAIMREGLKQAGLLNYTGEVFALRDYQEVSI